MPTNRNLAAASSSRHSPYPTTSNHFAPYSLNSPTYWAARNLHLSLHTRAQRPHDPHKYVALSTQWVGVGPGKTPMLVRISICDYRGNVVLDTFVHPTQAVADYRADVTGLQPQHVWTAPSFVDVQAQVAAKIRGRILVGHTLWSHLSLIGLCHPAIDTRDTALFLPFRRALHGGPIIPLKHLVSQLLRRKIGYGYEHPLEEARAALDLFRSYEEPWEDVVRAGSWPCALAPSAFNDFFS